MADDIQNNDFSHEIIGAAVEVQRVLGTGLPEAVYAAALAIELAERELQLEEIDEPGSWCPLENGTAFAAAPDLDDAKGFQHSERFTQ